MHKHANLILTILLASLLVLPSASALLMGVHGRAWVDVQTVGATAYCTDDRASALAFAEGSPSTASTAAGGLYGTYDYRPPTAGYGASSHASFQGTGPTWASATASHGTTSASAKCTSDGYRWADPYYGLVMPGLGGDLDDVESVLCLLVDTSGPSVVEGHLALLDDGSTAIAGQRDGADVLLPTTLAYDTPGLEGTPVTVLPVEVRVEFEPGACGVTVGA